MVQGFRAYSNPKTMETGLRTISAGISYTLLLKTEAIGLLTFGLLLIGSFDFRVWALVGGVLKCYRGFFGGDLSGGRDPPRNPKAIRSLPVAPRLWGLK